jgi:hypothetical protein
MNFADAHEFSSRLLALILLHLRDTPIGLFVDKTRGAGFVVAMAAALFQPMPLC